mmetsp:Transcript_23781/g.58243  ORF Transcript_23781/g.58243 Transcript_23781/m.58243 type:complete len:108 (-) Transcript_23781:503-826(-)
MILAQLKNNLLVAALFLLVAPATAYPIYKFGLFKGDASDTADAACSSSGKRNKCFIWDLGEYPDCYEFSATESYSGADFTENSLTYDLHPTSSKFIFLVAAFSWGDY